MESGLAAILIALLGLVETGIKIKGTIRLLGTIGEEIS